MLLLIPILLVALLLAGSSLLTRGPARTGPPAGGDDPQPDVTALTDQELAGQVLMPYLHGDHPTEVSPEDAWANQEYAGVDTPAELVERYQVAGVILLAPNITSADQLRELTAGLQAGSNGPLLVGIDQEYGVVSRFTEGVTALPSAMAFGAAGDPDLTEAAWQAAGAELAALGVNVNFAPVADVLGEARGGVIGSRSYGSEPTLVAGQVAAVVRGLQAAGVAATLKHFPGHGDTALDSHDELPTVAISPETLAGHDLPPFVAGIDAGAWLTMSGHLDARTLDPGVPATFSHPVVTELLRGELDFDGVAVTDALNMTPALRWGAGEAAVRALLAGNDLLLMPPDLAGAYQGILAALADGSLPRERLEEAVTRVLTLKQRLAAEATPAPAPAGGETHHPAVASVAQAAVTLLRGPCTTGPLVEAPVTVTAAGGREHARQALTESLAEAGVEVVNSGGTVVHLVGYGDDRDDLQADATVTVAMDTPYLLERSDSPVLLATYSSSQLSMAGLAAVLTGQAMPLGRSPVPLSDLPRSACDH